MISIDIISTDLEKWSRKIAVSGKNLDLIKLKYLQQATLIAQTEAKQTAPRKTSILAASIQAETNVNQGRVYTSLSYAPYQEYGTGIYGRSGTPITPKNKKVLSWVSGGKRIFAKSVKGVKPRRFMKKGFEKAKDYIQNLKPLGQKIIDILKL